MIRFDGIRKSYAGRHVLDVPSLELQPGVRYAVVGPNGSGKSTLLRILAGVLQPDAGAVHMEAGLSIGYMPQQPYAYDISVVKNVMLALPGKNKQADQAKAMEALRLVGMDGFAQAKGNRLSGGETQRMALARIICCSHNLVILDEPSSATDIAGNMQVEDALRHYFQHTGCTAIFSTHSLAQAHRLADVALVMDRGIIVEQGGADEVLHRPQSEGARAFLQYWQMDS